MPLRDRIFALLLFFAINGIGTTHAQIQMDFSNATDRAAAGKYTARALDWRVGGVVYQVLVDRFAPPADAEAKRGLYPAPKVLRRWEEPAARGKYLEAEKLWSHEIDFWGGDLPSLRGKLGYVKSLGVTTLFLNPIHNAYTNHKYDGLELNELSPEIGKRADLALLAREVHALGMKLVLDGGFNHMGRNAPRFKEAETNPRSPYRDWFVFGPGHQGGARTWRQAQNLPELNFESAAVRNYIYAAPDSVVRNYLRDGIDGWRIDVAMDIGFRFLSEMTAAAHETKPGSLLLGEIANYPKEWFPALDGTLLFPLRELIVRIADGSIEPPIGAAMIARMYADADFDAMLRSWVYLDNHDTPRLATRLPNVQARQLAQMLQFTLPGTVNLYYGNEIDMVGGDDPESRGPMRWDLVEKAPASMAWLRDLVRLRENHRALRVGDLRWVTAQRLLGYERFTDRAADTVIVLINPTNQPINETIMIANSKLMSETQMRDLVTVTGVKSVVMRAGLLTVDVPAQGFRVLSPDTGTRAGNSLYKYVQ